MPSGTGSPLPSVMRPPITIARGSSRGTTSRAGSARSSPIARYGPTVWDGVSPGASAIVPILGRGTAAADDDVEAVAEPPVRHRQLHVEDAHQTLPRGRVA